MHIGISTASFYPTLIEKGILHAAALGFGDVELFINSESEYRAPFRAQLKRQLADCGLHVVSVHPYTSATEGHLLFSDYPRRTCDALDQYERYFEAAGDLGARYFTFHGESLRPRGLPPSRSAEHRFETYHALCARAARYGVTFTQENVSWCRSSDLDFLRGLYDNVPELRFTLDIKQAHRAGRDWSDYVERIGDRIVNLHLSDYDAETDCLLPGKGTVDFAALFTALWRHGYAGDALVEVYQTDYTTLEQLSACRQYLQRQLEQATKEGACKQ